MEEDLVWISFALAVLYTIPRSAVKVLSLPAWTAACVVYLVLTPQLSKHRFSLGQHEFMLKEGLTQLQEGHSKYLNVAAPEGVVLAAYCILVAAAGVYIVVILHRLSPCASLVGYIYAASALFFLLQDKLQDDTQVYQVAFLSMVAGFSVARRVCVSYHLAALPVFAVVRYLPTTLIYTLVICVSHDALLAAITLLSSYKLSQLLWGLAMAAVAGELFVSIVFPFAALGGSTEDDAVKHALTQTIPALCSIYALSKVFLYVILDASVSWNEAATLFTSTCLVCLGIAKGIKTFLATTSEPIPVVTPSMQLACLASVALLSLPRRAVSPLNSAQDWSGFALVYLRINRSPQKQAGRLRDLEKAAKAGAWSSADTDHRWQKSAAAVKAHECSYKRALKRLEQLDPKDDSHDQLERRIKAIISVVQCSRSYTQSAEEQAKLSREIADEIDTLRRGYKVVTKSAASATLEVLTHRSKLLMPQVMQSCEDLEKDVSKINQVVQEAEERAEQAAYAHRHHVHKTGKFLERLDAFELPARVQKRVNLLNREILKPLFKDIEGKQVVTINLREANRIPDSVSKYGDTHRRSLAMNYSSSPGSMRRRVSTKSGASGSHDRNGSLNAHVQVSPAFKEKKRPWWSRYARRSGSTKER